jgi:hypothetical protein
LGSINDGLLVSVIWRDDINQVNVLAVKDIAVVVVGIWDAPLFSEGFHLFL